MEKHAKKVSQMICCAIFSQFPIIHLTLTHELFLMLPSNLFIMMPSNFFLMDTYSTYLPSALSNI